MPLRGGSGYLCHAYSELHLIFNYILVKELVYIFQCVSISSPFCGGGHSGCLHAGLCDGCGRQAVAYFERGATYRGVERSVESKLEGG